MKLNAQTPKQSLNKAFLKQPVNRDDITLFKANLQTLLGKINDKESEEHHKNFVRDFLKDTFYKSDYEINTKGRQDLVIHVGKNASDKVGVILEAKKPLSPEMILADNPNRKALHELILYYFNERNEAHNFELKNLVITNIYQWFVFDANVFDKQIYRNTQIKRLYETYKADKKDNPFFYGELQKIISNLDEEISCASFDIRKYEAALNNADLKDDESLIELFKILSPQHLLKVPFADDSNKLDKNFYTELLHIIGLEEIKDKGKLKIQRKDEARRDAGSLIENTITIIKTEDLLPNVANIENYGEKEERLFNVALDLCLTWINRILFLKLLEAQLVDYHKGNREFRFLDTDTIKDFDGLYRLFHQVLAINLDERIPQVKEKFWRVPYLNSSLFEFTDLEKQTLRINALNDRETLSFINSTVLKDTKAKQNGLPTLEYLFKFLDAYDFASEGAEGIKENNRSLINASVLGKVFEKINGYKDGSIYTPGFITMYMCRQAIRLAVVQKFKDKYEIDIDTFEDLEVYVGRFYKTANILDFNALINSLHLCDPAVGSGHFLVSSLNEIIAIKSELGIFADSFGKTFSNYKIEVENDELITTHRETGDFFKYQITDGRPANAEAQRLQKTLFHEKQTLIENCLFGVDINPNSVKICRLRLWIELLKNAYYKESSDYAELETLPNIDINIKEGNSLVSRFALDEDLKQVLSQVKYSIEDYRNFVLQYKETRDREKKRDFEAKIKQIKSDFKTQLFFFSPERRELADFENQLRASESKQFLFGESDEEKAKRFEKETKLKAGIERKKAAVKQIEENAIYKNAFEWRFEFPEVLDDDGNFLGFDVVIGNPPYIAGKDLSNEVKNYLKNNYQFSFGKFDLYISFIEKGLSILKSNKNFCFIIPNTILANENAYLLRKYMFENVLLDTVVTIDETVFDEAFVESAIIELNNFAKREDFQILNKHFELIRSIKYEEISAEKDNRIQITINEIDEKLIQKIFSKSIILGEILDFCIGIQIGGEGNSEEFKSKYISLEKISDEYKKMIDGKDFEPFLVKWSGKYIKYGDWLHRKRDSKYYLNPKIIIRQIGMTPVCTVDYENFYSLNTVYNGILLTKDFNLNYIFSVINSRLIKFVWLKRFHDSKTLFPKIKKSQLVEIPIPKIEEKDQQPFVALVDQILELKKAGKDTLTLEDEIDTLVYRLYDLTDDEVKIVESKGN